MSKTRKITNLIFILGSSISGFPYHDNSTTKSEDSAILITGGYGLDWSYFSSSEGFGSPCRIPDLPLPLSKHLMTVTSDNLILTCGGISPELPQNEPFNSDCYSLSVHNQTWIKHSSLDMTRTNGPTVSLPAGVFIFSEYPNGGSSSFLPSGSSRWEAGPKLPHPEGSFSACSVAISDTKFLVIGGWWTRKSTSSQIWEYDIETSSWVQWPDLLQQRQGHSCARLGDNVIISGGTENPYINPMAMSSTTILSITSKTSRPGRDMTTERTRFGMATMNGKVFAYGGGRDEYHADEIHDIVDEWDEKQEKWVTINMRMEVPRRDFGSIVAPASLICS